MSCSHPRLIVGLDHSYCPDCRKSFTQLSLFSESPRIAQKPARPLLAEPPTPRQPMDAQQLSLFSQSPESALLAETEPDTSASDLARLHQKIYECPSHGQRYFKYVCSLGHKIEIQRWIPGGNVRNRTAQRRAAQVRTWIKEGVGPREIDRRIQVWSKRV